MASAGLTAEEAQRQAQGGHIRGLDLKRRDRDMVVGANGHIQMDEPFLVQLLQQLPVQI